AERALETRERRLLLVWLRKELRRDPDALRSGPFQKLRAVEAVLAVGAGDWKASLVDPAKDRLLGDAAQSRGIPDPDLDPHRSSSPARTGRRARCVGRAPDAVNKLWRSDSLPGQLDALLLELLGDRSAVLGDEIAVRLLHGLDRRDPARVAVLEARHHV